MWTLLLSIALANPTAVSLRLADALGENASGTVDLTVLTYQTETSSPAQHVATIVEVPLVNGIASVPLDIPGRWLADGDAWIQLQVDGADLGARRHVLALPVANTVQRVSVLDADPAPCTAERIGQWYFHQTQKALKACVTAGEPWQ